MGSLRRIVEGGSGTLNPAVGAGKRPTAEGLVSH